MINSRLVNITLITFGLSSIIFIIFPQLDLTISGLFFDENSGFKYKEYRIVSLPFKLIPILTTIYSVSCLAYLAYILLKFQDIKKLFTCWAFFLFITAAIVPGVIVNSIFKENFGRARPSQITEFNGFKNFTRAYEITDECQSNCSFSSGHAAMGYHFSAIAYIVASVYFTRIYLAGILFGTLVGISRIAMGGHFTSDVIASGIIVLFINHLIYILWSKLKK